MTEQVLDQALIEEATKKSGLIWVRGDGTPSTGALGPGEPAQALWHVWHDGAVCLVGDGPGEQPLPGLSDGGEAVVTVRSKDKGGRLVAWTARVVELAPDSDVWQETVAELKGKRLNAPDGEEMPARWARECRVLRLEPLAARSRCRTARWPPRPCRPRRRPGSRSRRPSPASSSRSASGRRSGRHRETPAVVGPGGIGRHRRSWGSAAATRSAAACRSRRSRPWPVRRGRSPCPSR